MGISHATWETSNGVNSPGFASIWIHPMAGICGHCGYMRVSRVLRALRLYPRMPVYTVTTGTAQPPPAKQGPTPSRMAKSPPEPKMAPDL
jgi:hypothetical protein